MAGLLGYVAAGAAKGIGDAMMLKAQQQREDTLLALAQANKESLQSNEFSHQDTEQQAGFTQQNTMQGAQQGFESGQTDKQIAAHHADVQTQEAGAAGRSAAEIAGRHEDVGTQTKATIAAANIRSGWENQRTDEIAQRYANGKSLTPGQAALAARQAYSEMAKQSGNPVDGEGNEIPAATWIDNETTRLLGKYGSSANSEPITTTSNGAAAGAPDYSDFGGSVSLGGARSGGGLLNPSGTPSAPSMDSAPALTAPATDSSSGNTVTPPDGFSKAPDGNYYAPDPSRPGKYLMWNQPGQAQN